MAGPGQPVRANRLYRSLRLPVTVALLAFLLWKIDLGTSFTIASHAHVPLLVAALAVMVVERYTASYRWYSLLPEKHGSVTFRQVVRLVLTSTFLGYFLPGMGVEVLRVFGLSRVTLDPAQSLASVLVERVSGLLVLIAFIFIGLLFTPLHLPPVVGLFGLVALAMLALGSLAIMHRRARLVTDRLLAAVRLDLARAPLQKLHFCLDAYRDRPLLLLWTLVLACLLQALKIASVPLAAWALGIFQVPLVDFFVVVPTVLLLGMMPISVGGLGVRETGYVYLLGFTGVSPEAAFSLSMVTFLLHLLSVSPGAWLYARGGIQG